MIKKLVFLQLILTFAFSTNVFAFDLEKAHKISPFPANFNHQRAFELAAEELIQSKFISEKNSSINILYPGGGSHIAVLKLGQELTQLNSSIKDINFFITDISEDALNQTRQYIKAMAEEVLEEKIVFTHGYEMVLSFLDKDSGVNYKITYALDRSDFNFDMDFDILPEGRILYYRQSYFDDADIVIHHDSSNDRQVSTFISDFMLSLQRSTSLKPKAFLFEDLNRFNDLKMEQAGSIWINYNLLKGKKVLFDTDFGCRKDDPLCDIEEDHLGEAKYRGMVVFYPDTDFWKSLNSKEIKSLIMLSTLNTYPDTGAYNPDGIYMLILNNNPLLLKQVSSSLNLIVKKIKIRDVLMFNEICKQVDVKKIFDVQECL